VSIEPDTIEIDQQHSRPWWRGCLLRLVALLCILGLLWLSVVQPYLVAVTQPAPRLSRPLLRLSLPGLDIGADAHPARPGEAGDVRFWLFFHHADDVWFLPPLPGAPALPEPAPPPDSKHAQAAGQEERLSAPSYTMVSTHRATR
jgi:hypothetical protein